jgi:hypothetical protein
MSSSRSAVVRPRLGQKAPQAAREDVELCATGRCYRLARPFISSGASRDNTDARALPQRSL